MAITLESMAAIAAPRITSSFASIRTAIHRAKICLCQWQKSLIRTKQAEQLVIKNRESDPADYGYGRSEKQGQGKISICLVGLPLCPVICIFDGTSAAGQNPQTVQNCPDRRYNRQGRRTLRPLILANHGNIHHPVYTGDHSASKGGAKIPEVKFFILPCVKFFSIITPV